MPISYVAISTYARDYGISGIDFSEFVHLIHELDLVFLQIEAERAKQRQAEQGGAAG